VATLRYETFTTAIYKHLAGRYDQAPAAVLSTALIALTVLLLLVQQRLWGAGDITTRPQGARSRWCPCGGGAA
jgi:ABC-type Fe3+ transport system permease subunit